MAHQTGEYRLSAQPPIVFARLEEYFHLNKPGQAVYCWEAAFPRFRVSRTPDPTAWDVKRFSGMNVQGELLEDNGGTCIRFVATNQKIGLRPFVPLSIVLSLPALIVVIGALVANPSQIGLWVAGPLMVLCWFTATLLINSSVLEYKANVFPNDIQIFQDMMEAALRPFEKAHGEASLGRG